MVPQVENIKVLIGLFIPIQVLGDPVCRSDHAGRGSGRLPVIGDYIIKGSAPSPGALWATQMRGTNNAVFVLFQERRPPRLPGRSAQMHDVDVRGLEDADSRQLQARTEVIIIAAPFRQTFIVAANLDGLLPRNRHRPIELRHLEAVSAGA